MLNKIKTFLFKPQTLIIALSLLFTLLVSAVIGLAGYLLSGKFLGFFLLGFGVQFVLFAIVNTALQRKDRLAVAKLANDQLEALSKFTIKLACAYCQTSNVTPIQLNQENRFKCESCGQVNSIRMQFFAAQITTPLNKVVIPAGNESIEFKTN